jgi:putative membrane protein
MGFEFGGGFGIFAVVAMVVGLVFWGLVIAALILGVRWLIRQNSQDRYAGPPAGTAGPAAEDPLEVLRHRYAKGEIDEEEYERRRKTLSGA